MPLPPIVQQLVGDLDTTRASLAQRLQPLVVGNVKANYQMSYLLSRLIDLGLVLERLGSQNERLIVLSDREQRLTPQVRPPLVYSKKLQAVMNDQQALVVKMRFDMESLYIFGNLILNHWAQMVASIYRLPGSGSWQYPYSNLHALVCSSTPPPELRELIDNHGPEIYWLFYNLRMYRNGFIEHLDNPVQRGATRPTSRIGFSFFIPSASGTVSANREAALHASIDYLTSAQNTHLPSTHWQRQPRGALEFLFHNIDTLVNADDRKAVYKVWQVLGGQTVSYEVVARRIINLVNSSIDTLDPPAS